MNLQPLIDTGRDATSLVSASREWSHVSDYPVDRSGPHFRPYQRKGADFANVSVFGHLRNIAHQHPDKLAISDGHQLLTYSELVGAVATLSHRIASNVPDGQAAGILLANSVWNPVALLASMSVGRLAVPLNAEDPASRLKAIATAARLSAIIGFGAAPDIGLARSVQWIDAAAEVVPSDQGTLSQSPSGSVDAPAIVLYASASTGSPRGIANSQRNLLQRVQQYVDACHADSGDVFLPLTGLATIAGCVEVLAALLSGATLHLLQVEAVGISAVRRYMQTAGVTITYLESTLLRAPYGKRSCRRLQVTPGRADRGQERVVGRYRAGAQRRFR